MKIFLAIIIAFPLFVAATCKPEPVPPAPPSPKADVAPLPAADARPLSPCALDCANWRRMKCVEGDPTPAGASCEEVCENVESSGIVSYAHTCIQRASTCLTARNCK